MRKFKGKKIIALLLSGVLIAGSADPVMTNAAEVSNEAATDTDHESGAGEGAEEQSTVRESEAGIIEGSTVTESGAEDTIAGGDAEDSADSTSGEAKTEKESSTESTATEESKTEHTTTEESSAESSTTEESSAESSTTEESSAESSTTEESSTESTTEVESGTEKTEEERTTEESTSTEETTETQVTETETESTEEEETQEEIKALKSDRQISGEKNILSKYNTSFEGVDEENGNLHWWNGPSWNQNGISRKAYENSGALSSDCGEYYLEVSPNDGKSEAQICQDDIAAIIQPETTYEFTYYAKLVEGQDSGEVQFQISSVSDGWSSVENAEIQYDKEITLDDSQWKQISGEFKLPVHDVRKQVLVKFAGSEGLSFCIDDLRIAAVDDENTGDDREISENILSNYNTSFEGVNESGNLYWWNGPSWSSDGISRKAYENSEKPSSDCGDYYLEVSPNDGKSEAQINDAGIAALIQPESTYEFTYYAKLSEGQKDGAVRLEVSGGGAKNAEIKLDKEVTLDAAQWQKVSGTFKLPASNNHKEVKVKFAGSDGLSFCIDDLRVAVIDKGDVEYGDNLVKNPYLAEEDLSMWEKAKGEASISTAAADQPVFDDITTYGVIENRTSSQECFAQDMTGILKSGSSYEYSFYAMLDAEDYKDAPANQREVCFAPFVKVDGESTYWGSYSSGILDSGCIKQIPAGEWTKFEGSFNPKFDGEAEEFVIRILEQGTKYGSGDCVKGRYCVTGVTLREIKKPVKEIEWDIPNLKDTVSSNDKGIGTDAYTGALLTVSDLSDQPLMDLVHKHFNAVTFENEMKMDAMFGYSNNEAPGLHTITWTRADGTEMTDFTVPTLDYSRADKILDALKKWNEENPDNAIKVRGHVLVWHSQAPEWFFHEDWDEKRPDASPEEMDARQEWYIKTVLEHYTGNDSPYKDMFYGWDVVNEAVSDGSGTYRHEDEKSSWWRVYQSEDFIVNAFRYANYYAPSDLELYYNDYNECVEIKVSGIEKLLTEVKSHEKDATLPTRISAMGMQSHHTVSSPTARQLKDAAIRYGKIVGKIQLTELDLKASNDFDGTDATLQDEYTRQAYRYKEIYDIMREVDAMDDIDVNGITVWGVIDGNSWLQDSSDVGGGADGSKRQVPLLFDDDYKAKPSFYAFVNAEKLEPYIRSITVMQAAEEDPYANGKTYEIQGVDAAFTPVWTDTELKIKVTVSDTSVSDDDDAAAVYIDWNKSASENADILSFRKTRAENREQEGGYVAEFTVPRELVPSMSFSMDVAVSDNGQTYAFNDNTMHQETSSKYYASAITKPYMTIAGVGKGIIKVDGEKEAVWDQAKEVQFQIRTGAAKASASARLLWDEQYLYVLADVTDAVLDNSSEAVHEQDSLEVFIDENNHKSDSYEEDDKQYRVNFVNKQSFNGKQCTAENILSAAVQTDKGYRIEAAYKWTDITPAIGGTIGIDLQINDAEGGTRIGTVSWYDESGMGWSSPSVFGTAALGGLIQTTDPEEPDVKELLNSLISECESLKKDEYTDESWIPFAKALEEAKAVQGNAEAAQEDLQRALDTLKGAKAGLQKRGEPEPVNKDQLLELIRKCGTLNQDGYTKNSWETFTKALAAAKAAAENETATQEEVQKAVANLSDALDQLKERQDLWAYDIADITYTGDAVRPEVTVYSGKTLLKQDKDYTVSYKDNTKPGANAKVIIKGKGNYAGSVTKTFKIVPKNLASQDITISDLFVKAPKSGRSITPAPVVMRDGKPLNKNAYRIGAIKDKSGKTVGQVTGAGTYTVTVNGVQENGYAGSREIKMTVLSSDQILMNTVKVTGIKNIEYTGSKAEPKFTVKYGKKTLTLNQDYIVVCDSREVGTATAVVKGIGEKYVGEKIVTFKIIGTALKAKDVTIENAADHVYTGKEIKPAVRIAGAQVNRDYVVSYEKNVNAGTAVATIKGIGRYSGTVRKTFKIAAFDIKENAGGKLKYSTSVKVPYMKGGSQLKASDLKAVFGGVNLVEGVDYTLSYTANKKLGTATVRIKGKGNFKGTTAPMRFTIEQQNLANLTDITAADVLEKNAKRYNRVNPVLRDLDGKVLKKGKDYTITGYTKEDGKTPISGTPKTGDRIRVKVEGRNCYTGVSYADFRIIENDRDIARAKVKVAPQNYTGKEITVSEIDPVTGKRQIMVTMKVNGVTMTLKEGKDYEIVKTGSYKNINKGTGKLTIRGIHGFGGTKTVSFQIKAQDLDHVVWYDSLFSKTMSFFHKQ